jgi:hypothetical protein
MLLFPSFWEHRAAPGVHQQAGSVSGRSTLRADDLVPAWRGPAPRGEKDG